MTRAGKIELHVHKDRDGRLSREMSGRFQRSEKVLVSALAEMYIQWVSSRKVKAITEQLCGHSFNAQADRKDDPASGGGEKEATLQEAMLARGRYQYG